jgi:uncharacterized protein YjbI with pentapeptide repeats
MSERQPITSAAVATTADQRPAPDGYSSWNDYWTRACNQPWRTRPEIDAARQRYLDERRACPVRIEVGIYPFRDENGSIKLTRADVEWLLATHEGGRGPVDWNDRSQHQREGLDLCGADLCGADLRGVDLSQLPLTALRAGLSSTKHRRHAWRDATVTQRAAAAAQLQRANLEEAHLEDARLNSAHLEEADLSSAHLQGARLVSAHLEAAVLRQAQLGGAALQGSFFDAATNLDRTSLGDKVHGGASFADIRWGDVNLASVDWDYTDILGDERRARTSHEPEGEWKSTEDRSEEFESAMRANRQLATVLRAQGLNELGDRYFYRAQVLQRQLLRRRGAKKWPAYTGSLLLWALSGYGYRLWRIFTVYLLTLLVFAALYYVIGLPNTQGASQPQTIGDAFLVSLTAIHGRVFLEPLGQHSLQAWVAAVESVVGIVLEGVFVAMLIQRFFSR